MRADRGKCPEQRSWHAQQSGSGFVHLFIPPGSLSSEHFHGFTSFTVKPLVMVLVFKVRLSFMTDS